MGTPGESQAELIRPSRSDAPIRHAHRHRQTLAGFCHGLLAPIPFPPGLYAQRKVDPEYRYERLICIVPMVGTGTAEDPRRPQSAPSGPGEASPILAYSYIMSDDETWALVEFVAPDASAFAGMCQSSDSRVKRFRKGKNRRADVETAFKPFRRNLDLSGFGTRVQ